MATEPMAHTLNDSSTLMCERRDRDDGIHLMFRGELLLDHGSELWTLGQSVLEENPSVLILDLSHVDHVDGGMAAIIVRIGRLAEYRGAKVDFNSVDGAVSSQLRLYHSRSQALEQSTAASRGSNLFAQVGESTLVLWRWCFDFLDYIGQSLQALGRAIQNPRALGWSQIPRLMEKAGADATSIVILINFLIGLIMAYQSAEQLANFGANIFVANLVGLAMVRELGPLMTAIIVTGRSGAGFAAELGTMKVSEEIDALKAMGFCPFLYLTFPRVISLTLVLPLLAVMANLVGILGGLVVGVLLLDLTPYAYFSQTEGALDLWDVGGGLLKSAVFGFLIALIACQQGLWTRGGAEGVGRSTTAAVVKTLFVLVLVDAIFTVLFRIVGV